MRPIDITSSQAKLASAVRTLIPCALVAQEMLVAVGKRKEAHKIALVVNLSEKFLIEAGEAVDA
jgi:hypothetical protein